MHLLLVLVICFALFPHHPGEKVAHPGWAALLTGFGVAASGVIAHLLARHFASQLYQMPGERSYILRWYGRARLLHLLLTLGIYLVSLYWIRWGEVVRYHWNLDQAILVDELLILAPFLVSLILGWFFFYQVEKALAETALSPGDKEFWSRPAYVLFHVRHYLGLVLAPMFLFTGINDLILWQMPGLIHNMWFQVGSMVLMIGMILVVMPWLLTVIWGARSLPPGPLRDRLEAVARRLRFSYTDILLWNTRGGVANAMVTGILPFPRYVLLSDGLLENLHGEEIEAVFGHEVGHVKHYHMLLYLGFLSLSLFLLTLVMPTGDFAGDSSWSEFAAWWSAEASQWTRQLLSLAFLGGYIWLVFGFLSRRCERQADVFGCRAVSCADRGCQGHDGQEAPVPSWSPPALCPTGIQTFIRALEKVADLNGIRRDKRSWRHSSIAWRVQFLKGIIAEPGCERRFQRRLLAVKYLLFSSLTALVVLAAWWQGLRWSHLIG
jgi:STE24 endopeptidase